MPCYFWDSTPAQGMSRTDHTPSTVTGFLALVAALTLWSVISTVLKYFTGYLDAWTMMGVRFTLAALFFAENSTIRHYSVRPWWQSLNAQGFGGDYFTIRAVVLPDGFHKAL